MAEAHIHPRIAWRSRNFRYLQFSRFLAIIGWQMQTVAISYKVYEMTGDPLDLGYIGLAQFLPAAGLSLLVGHVADRFDRRRIIMICQAVLIACSLGLAALMLAGPPSVWPVFALLFVIGSARAFNAPASQALLPMTVPIEHFSNAVMWNSTNWEIGTIFGPALGGLLYSRGGGPVTVFVADAVLTLGALAAIASLRLPRTVRSTANVTWDSVLAGVRYIRRRPIIFGSISLDLFAVLLGGATALLPIYARDILHVGAFGFGWLRAAPAVGAGLTAMLVAHLPPMRRAGATMLWCVAGFGAATIVFGLSRSFAVSLVCLALLGAFDMIGVIVRHTLVQVLTPDAMRGRVSAVNMVFIGASNELGEFESGFTARWFGAAPAVVIGGLGTLAVVAIWAWRFPELRRFRRLDQARPEE